MDLTYNDALNYKSNGNKRTYFLFNFLHLLNNMDSRSLLNYVPIVKHLDYFRYIFNG